MLRVVLERLGKVPQPMMGSAEGAIHPRSHARHGSPHGGSHRPGRARSCAATPRQSAAPSSCPSIPKHAHLVSRRLRCRAGVSTSSGHALALVSGPPRLDLAATKAKGAGWGGRATVRHLRVCVSGACACAHVYVTYTHSLIHSDSCLCVRLTSR